MRRLLVFLLLLSSTPAWAHPEWKHAACTGAIDEQHHLTLTVKFDVPSFLAGKPPKEATTQELDALMLMPAALASAGAEAPRRFLRGLVVTAEGKDVAVRLAGFPTSEEVKAIMAKQGEAERYPVLLNAKVEADLPPGARQVALRFPAELGPVFVNLRQGMGSQVVAAVGVGEVVDLTLDEAPAAAGFFYHLVGLFGDGFSHVIPEGWDHCLFMLAMFLGAASLRQALARSLVFTAGHSITLTMVALGMIGSVGAWVEPFIALTIGVGGLLAFGGWSHRRSALLVPALFGLVHGLGFAAALAGRVGTWDRSSVLRLLVGFNLGVESAQVLVIALSSVVLWLLAKCRLPESGLRRGLGLGVAAVGFAVMFVRGYALLAGG